MNGNTELLNFIYQNAQMGVNTTEQLIKIVEDAAFRKQLEAQHGEYQSFLNEATEKLHQSGCDEKGINAFDKIKTYLMINLQTLADRSPEHISEMMIIGSNMGVINAVKNIKKYSGAERDILELMQRLLQFEENNIQSLKEFLA
ncbi:MAG: hypothetical protein AAGU74_14975 [Bacillota bacterium]